MQRTNRSDVGQSPTHTVISTTVPLASTYWHGSPDASTSTSPNVLVQHYARCQLCNTQHQRRVYLRAVSPHDTAFTCTVFETNRIVEVRATPSCGHPGPSCWPQSTRLPDDGGSVIGWLYQVLYGWCWPLLRWCAMSAGPGRKLIGCSI